MTMQQLAREAILVQNACNPTGLSRSFAETTLALSAYLSGNTDAICEHPVFRLWASKMHDLAGMGLSDTDRYGEAYEACRKLAGVNE